jgi:HSP20 family protein
MNVSETGQEIRVEAELPGVPEQDVHLELTGDMLTIRGEKRAEHEDALHHLVEWAFGTFRPHHPPALRAQPR